MTVHIPEHEYPTVNGPRIAPERWETLLNVEDRIYGPDIRVTVSNARGSLARVKADIFGTYQRWPEPTSAQLRAILDTVLASVGRERTGERRIETGRWEWLYPTRERGAL